MQDAVTKTESELIYNIQRQKNSKVWKLGGETEKIALHEIIFNFISSFVSSEYARSVRISTPGQKIL